MIAKYIRQTSCSQCMDYNFIPDCVLCINARTRNVEIIKLGVDIFGNKAIIKDIETGDLATWSPFGLRKKNIGQQMDLCGAPAESAEQWII